MRARCDGVLRAAGVGDEDGDGEAGVFARIGDDLRCVGELREELGGHERADFDFGDAGIYQRVNPGAFCSEGHDGRDGL